MTDRTEEALELAKGVIAADEEKRKMLTQLAKDIAGNLVFTDRHIRTNEFEQIMPSIFMPIVFGALAPPKPKYKGTTVVAEDGIDRDNIGMIYEYYSESLPRSINGYPIFMSMRILSKEDAEFVWEKVRKIQEVMEEI